MPPRPALKVKQSRPLSAVYIGKGSFINEIAAGTPPNLPDLPEPPSPGSSPVSMKSGLPSPPATNSTGSGSTGDPATVAVRGRFVDSGSGGAGPSVDGPMRSYQHQHQHQGSSSSTAEVEFDDDYEHSDDRGDEGHENEECISSTKQHDIDDDEGVYGDVGGDGDDDDEGGDDTARLDRRLMAGASGGLALNAKSSSENVMALQRVRSLAQRNRLALDKLSRLSPSPGRSSSLSRSPIPPSINTNAANASSASRLSSTSRQSRSSSSSLHISSPQDLSARSGSETERESVSAHHSSGTTYSSHSSSSRSSIHHHPSHSSSSLNLHESPPNSTSTSSQYTRNRHVSTPSSPHRTRGAGSSGSGSGNSPTSRRRKRASLASMSNFHLTDFEEEDAEDLRASTGTARERDRVTTSNTNSNGNGNGNANTSTAREKQRESPVNGTGAGGARRRAALPREFRSDLADEGAERTTSLSRLGGRRSVTGGYEDNESWKRTQEPMTPYRDTTLGRSSTLRETRRISGGPGTSNPRWSPDELRTPATVRDHHHQHRYTPSFSNEDRRRERHQSLRGGSAESALMWSPGGRSVVGEGLRAAGLIKDSPSQDSSVGRKGMTSAGPVQDVFRDRDRGGDRERRAEWSPQDVLDEGRRRVLGERERGPGGGAAERYPPRAATSMAQYSSLEDHDTSPETRLRAHRSTYSLVTRDPETLGGGSSTRRAGSALNRYSASGATHSPMPSPAILPAHLQQERVGTASPFGSRRFSALPLSSSANTTNTASGEHVRLMQDSLTVFESQLSKLSSLSSSSSSGLHSSSSTAGGGNSTTHAELLRNAHNIVTALDRLSSLLRANHAHAVEQQVDIEVDGAERVYSAQEVLEMTRKTAGEMREGMRGADEMIRAVTGVWLGFGRVLRDLGGPGGSTSAAAGAGEWTASPVTHTRQISVDDYDESPEHTRSRGAPSASGSGAASGSGTGGEAQSGRLSVASRRSWEPADRTAGHREEALRRLAGGSTGHTQTRSESVLARASPATFQRLRDREGRERESLGREGQRESLRDRDQFRESRESLPARDQYRVSLPPTRDIQRERDREVMQETPSRPPRHSQSTSGVERRLGMPREQRDVMLVSELGEVRGGGAGGMSTFDSQETVHAAASSGSGREYEHAYEPAPSPSPASRQLQLPRSTTSAAGASPLERVRALPAGTPLLDGKRLPGTPLETFRRLPGTPLVEGRRLPSTPLEGTRKLPTTPLEGTRKLPPLDIPKPIPALPSERRSRSTLDSSANSSSAGDSASGGGNGSTGTGSGTSSRRRLTIRGTAPSFPTLTTPSNAAAVLTPHTVSNSPVSERPRTGAGGMVRSESSKSGLSGVSGNSGGQGRAQVTFSRPGPEGGVEAQLTDTLDKARKRTLSATSPPGSAGLGASAGSSRAGQDVVRDVGRMERERAASAMLTPVSGPETSDRESRRRTLGSRISSARYGDEGDARDGRESAAARAAAAAVVHAADRSAASRILQPTQSSAARGSPRERRRTVTDVFPA
ncbi:hypothetical protein BJ165DRAFT_1411160 [Panaeolus papilionaceus]|nr:hypothetical protein BJ165DRAFT_1411160 [Panaeolus papilionaceus]